MAVTQHIWTTQEEYEEQLALPMHMDTLGMFGDRFAHGTLCGIVYPPDEVLRSTSDATAVTCESCLGKL